MGCWVHDMFAIIREALAMAKMFGFRESGAPVPRAGQHVPDATRRAVP